VRRPALSAALFLFAAAARAEPPQGDSDEAGIAMQMTRVEDDIKTSRALVRDDALERYLHGVTCSVAGVSCGELRVYLVEMPGENVIALPNGALVIWSGTLLRMDNEAQLAQLLAHEIAHYWHKDTLRQYQRRLDTSGLVALLGVAASGVGMGFMGTPASMAALDARYAHSLSEEKDADRTGLELAAAAGYDPAAAAAIWRNAETDYLRLHPGHEAASAIKENAAPSGRTGAESYHAVTAGWQSRWVDDELRNGGDSVSLFTRLAVSGRGLFRYGLGEAYRKRAKPGDADMARQAFRAALASPDAEPQAWRGLGLLAMQEGDKKAARAAFAQYRAVLPLADDRAMIDYYLAQP